MKLGGPSRLMFITGRIAVDEAGCVYSAAGEGVGLVWPDDYTVRTGPEGTVDILGPDGAVVFREGDWFHAGGGVNDDPLPGDCGRRYPEVVGIDTEVGKIDRD